MTTIIRDTVVVTADGNDTVLHEAAIAIEGGAIVAIGPSDAITRGFAGAETVDGRGRMVMPGFANIHTHLPLIIAKGIYEDLSPPNHPPFTSGLAPIPTPDLSREELVAMVRLAALEAIRSGTTALLEDGTSIADYASELADTGIRLLLCERSWDKATGSIGDQGGFEASQELADITVARIKALHAAWHGTCNGRVEVGIAAWAPDMCSPELLRRLKRLQENLGCIATIHLNQIWGEVAAVETVRG